MTWEPLGGPGASDTTTTGGKKKKKKQKEESPPETPYSPSKKLRDFLKGRKEIKRNNYM